MADELQLPVGECVANEQTCMPPEETPSVLRKVQRTFVQHMYPIPVLDVMTEEELLPPEILRDIKESGTTSKINRKLLQCIQSRNSHVFNKFKECLHKTGQGRLLALLETAEKGEDTTEIRRQIKLQSHQNKVFQEMQQIVRVSNHNKIMSLCYACAHVVPKVFKSLLEENVDLQKPAEEIQSSWTIVGYLQKHEQKLKRALTKISDDEKKMLYPADASVPDLDAWSVPLFCFVLSETCSFDEEIAEFLQLMRDQDWFFSKYTDNTWDERFGTILTLLKKCICQVKDTSMRLALLAELDQLEAGIIPGTDLALVRKAFVHCCEDVKKSTRAQCTEIREQTLTALEKGNKGIEEKLDYLIDCENAKKSNRIEKCNGDDYTSDMCSCTRVKSRHTRDVPVVINDSSDDSGSSEATNSGCASQINLEELVKTVTKNVVSRVVQTGLIQDSSSIDDFTTQSAARTQANQTRTVLSGGPSHQVEKLENNSIASFKVMINNCSKETEAFISDLCVKEINNINAESAENALCSSQIAKAIQSTLLQFRDKGQTIVKAELGCIKLYVQCSSAMSVLTLLRDYETGGLDESFHTLQNAMQKTIDGCEDLELETLMYEEEVNAILSQLGTRVLRGSSYDDVNRRWANTTTSEEKSEHCGNASSEMNKELRRVQLENVCDASTEMKIATSTSPDVPEGTRLLCRSSSDDVSKRWAITTSEEKSEHCGNASSEMIKELRKVKLENGFDASTEMKTVTRTSPDAPKGNRLLCGSSNDEVSNTTISEEELEYCCNASSDINKELSGEKLENGFNASAEMKSVTSTSPDVPEESDKEEGQITVDDIYVKERTALQKALTEFYRRRYRSISVSPVQEDLETDVIDVYVRPPIQVFDPRESFRLQRGIAIGTYVTSYKQMLLCNNGHHYKNIYLIAKSGVGKTTFCKHLSAVWCQGHNPDKSAAEKFVDDDIQTLRQYQLAFFISLGEVHESHCDVDKMIKCFIKGHLTFDVSMEFLTKMFLEERCLVVLDGLDEWIHPKTCKVQKNPRDIPHQKRRANFTVLTTTRSWKLDVIRLKPSEYDRRLDLHELDDTRLKKLETKVLKVLNRTFGKSKTADAFSRAMEKVHIREILHTPYVHLQCLCLWFNDGEIGRSKCQIYANLIEATLERRKNKFQPEFLKEIDEAVGVPSCFKHKYCNQHMALLKSVSKMACDSILNKENRQLLAMDHKFVSQYLNEEELNYCLNLGLLSQNKDYGMVAKRVSNMSFLHKTIQEFFCAMYIQSVWTTSPGSDPTSSSSERETVQNIIYDVCSDLSKILDISAVLIFLSGLDSQQCSQILKTLSTVVTRDSTCKAYRARVDLNDIHYEYSIMFHFQTLLTDCAYEMMLNGGDVQSLPLEEIMINKRSKRAEHMSLLQSILQTSETNIKTLDIQECVDTTELTVIFDMLHLRTLSSLEKLVLWAVAREQDVQQLLQQSTDTLRTLSLSFVNNEENTGYTACRTELSEQCTDRILSMQLLQAVMLQSLLLSHNQWERIVSFITSRTTMKQIWLAGISCRDHRRSCPGVMIDLSLHENLELLTVHEVPVSLLQVNNRTLKECWIGDLPSSVISSCPQSLPTAQNLHVLSKEKNLSL